MMKRFVALAAATMLLGGIWATPAFTQVTQPAPAKEAPAKKKPAAKKPAKKPTAKQEAQRQKMKDCSAQWKQSGQKGRAAHRKFMSTCLKS